MMELRDKESGMVFWELFWFMKNHSFDPNKVYPAGSIESYMLMLFESIKEFSVLHHFTQQAKTALVIAAINKFKQSDRYALTLQDYKEHVEKMRNLLWDNYKLILVAYSQGNFVRKACLR